jgi:hypothetical protein
MRKSPKTKTQRGPEPVIEAVIVPAWVLDQRRAKRAQERRLVESKKTAGKGFAGSIFHEGA